MAIIDRDELFNKLTTSTPWNVPGRILRQSSLPLDTTSIFKTKLEAETYASTDPTAYPGQIVAVVEETQTTFYGINQYGELQELGGSSVTHVVDKKEDLSKLTEAKIGENAYVDSNDTDAGMYILTEEDPTNVNNWSKVSSDIVWSNGTKINFVQTNAEEYNGGNKDANTLYVVKDSQKIYLGPVDITSNVLLVEANEFPEKTSALADKLYVDKESFEMRVFDPEASDYIVLSPGYLTEGINWAEADDEGKLATVSAIKTAIAPELENITTAINNNKVTSISGTFTNGVIKTKVSLKDTTSVEDTTGVTLTGVAHDATYDSQTLTIQLYGKEPVTVDFTEMIKDKFLKSAEYSDSYVSSEHGSVSSELDGKKVIIFTINGETNPLVVSVDDLVDTYTSGSSDSDVIKVTVSANKISAALNITGSGDGKTILTVDETGKTLTPLTPAEAVGDAIAEAINSAITEEGSLKKALDAKLSKLDEGNADEVILSKADGTIARSGKKIGGATLAVSPDSNTLATEAAVAAAIQWEQI